MKSPCLHAILLADFDELSEPLQESSVFAILKMVGRFGERIWSNKYLKILDQVDETVIILWQKYAGPTMFCYQLSVY